MSRKTIMWRNTCMLVLKARIKWLIKFIEVFWINLICSSFFLFISAYRQHFLSNIMFKKTIFIQRNTVSTDFQLYSCVLQGPFVLIDLVNDTKNSEGNMTDVVPRSLVKFLISISTGRWHGHSLFTWEFKVDFRRVFF